MIDLLDRSVLKHKIDQNIKDINYALEHMYKADTISAGELIASLNLLLIN